jgi:hypothetical protein
VAPQGKLIIRAEVDEMFSNSIKIGDTVEIVNIGSSNVMAKGQISSMAPYLKKKSLFLKKQMTKKTEECARYASLLLMIRIS